MVRLIFFVIVIVVAFLVWLAKAAVGAVTGSEKLKQETLRSQTQKTMHTAARGVNWLNEQWEQAKQATRQPSGDPPYLALLIAVARDDRVGLEQARHYFDELAQHINGPTRIDDSIQDESSMKLVRLCIDVGGWSTGAVSAAIDNLKMCVAGLEEIGRAAFAVRSENGHNEMLAKNRLC